ncbi:hypothetical protein B0H11DRAFT_2343643 [Mycena galericulata]|nr:hypothetical protein B0H11DRAFT_2343643 [Mycena galericulata]
MPGGIGGWPTEVTRPRGPGTSSGSVGLSATNLKPKGACVRERERDRACDSECLARLGPAEDPTVGRRLGADRSRPRPTRIMSLCHPRTKTGPEIATETDYARDGGREKRVRLRRRWCKKKRKRHDSFAARLMQRGRRVSSRGPLESCGGVDALDGESGTRELKHTAICNGLRSEPLAPELIWAYTRQHETEITHAAREITIAAEGTRGCVGELWLDIDEEARCGIQSESDDRCLSRRKAAGTRLVEVQEGALRDVGDRSRICKERKIPDNRQYDITTIGLHFISSLRPFRSISNSVYPDKAEAESPAQQQARFRFELQTPDTSPPAHAFTFTPPRMSWPAGAPVYTLPYADYEQEQDEEEHEDELDDPGPAAASGSRAKEREREKEKERMIRRRSSKACDQCRKSKCKCERSAAGVRCRACEVLGTECTFLGPSRKRGPPKGYIDAIEARLHQTEALVGILLAAARGAGSIANSSAMADDELTKGVREGGEPGAGAARGKRGKGAGRGGGEDEDGGGDREEQDDGGGGDARAWAVLRDLGEDPLARAILARIDNSAYGPAGRGFGSSLSALLTHSNSHSNSNNPAASHTNSSSSSTQTAHLVRSDSRSRTSSPGGAGGGRKDEVGAEIASTHPSHEWMDRVTVHVLRRACEARGREARNKDKGGFDNRGGLEAFEAGAGGGFEHSPARGRASGASTPNGNEALSPYRYSGYAHPQHGHGHQQQQQQQQQHQQQQQQQQQHGPGGPPQRPAIITTLPLAHHAPPHSAGVAEYVPRSAGGEYVSRSAGGDFHGHGHGLAHGGGGYGAPLEGHGHGQGRAFPLSAGAGGRRLRRRVDGGEGVGVGIGMGMGMGMREGSAGGQAFREGSTSAYRDGSASAHAYRDGGGAFREPAFLAGPLSGGGAPSFHAPPYTASKAYSRGASPGSESEAELDVDVGVRAEPAGDGGGSGAADERDGGLAGAVGQLSLNEDKQVRYHGKASGLHLLARRAAVGENPDAHAFWDDEARGRARRREERGKGGEQEREDSEVGKNVGGIWRFPKARVWPAAPATERDDERREEFWWRWGRRCARTSVRGYGFGHGGREYRCATKSGIQTGVGKIQPNAGNV